MEYFKTEIKTGLTVIICLSLLILLTIGISGTKTLGRTYNITILFKNIGGLEEDAPVNYAGFEVGIVKNIRLTTEKERAINPEYNIAVKTKLDANAIVREDSIAQIKTLGYLGLKYIDISPGSPNSTFIKHKETILGFTPQDVNEIIEMVGRILNEINPKIQRILDGIENIVGEDGTLTVTIEELRSLINNADDVVKINKENIQKLITNLTSASENLKEFSGDIKDNPWKLLIKSKSKDSKSKKPEPRARSRRKQIGQRR